MPDLLVNLYQIESAPPALPEGIAIKRAMSCDRSLIIDFVKKNFLPRWVNECEYAMSFSPSKCFVAVNNMELVGFACYDAAAKSYFGPIGVKGDARGLKIGKALLLTALNAMRADGYGYAVVGWAASVEFYTRTVNAMLIENSEPHQTVFQNQIEFD